jgi:hypothetical protein
MGEAEGHERTRKERCSRTKEGTNDVSLSPKEDCRCTTRSMGEGKGGQVICNYLFSVHRESPLSTRGWRAFVCRTGLKSSCLQTGRTSSLVFLAGDPARFGYDCFGTLAIDREFQCSQYESSLAPQSARSRRRVFARGQSGAGPDSGNPSYATGIRLNIFILILILASHRQVPGKAARAPNAR